VRISLHEYGSGSRASILSPPCSVLTVDDWARGVTLQANGKIVAVGSGVGTDLSNDFPLARYLGK
jgi:hypothetical protein